MLKLDNIHIKGVNESDPTIKLTHIPSVVRGMELEYTVSSDEVTDEEIVLSCEIVGGSGVVTAFDDKYSESVYINLQPGTSGAFTYNVPDFTILNAGHHTFILYANEARLGHLLFNIYAD